MVEADLSSRRRVGRSSCHKMTSNWMHLCEVANIGCSRIGQMTTHARAMGFCILCAVELYGDYFAMWKLKGLQHKALGLLPNN